MDFRREALQIALGLIVVAAFLVAIYFFTSALIEKLNAINSDLGKTIVGAGVAAMGASLTIVIGKIWEQKISIRQQIRDRKIPIYEKQLRICFRMLFAKKLGEKPASEKEMMKAFAELSESLVIWGGPAVIKAWETFQTHPFGTTTAESGALAFEKFMLALRKDIGNSNMGLGNGDLLRLFVNDLDLTKDKNNVAT